LRRDEPTGPRMLSLVGDLSGPTLVPIAYPSNRRLGDADGAADPVGTPPLCEQPQHAPLDFQADAVFPAPLRAGVGHVCRMSPDEQVIGTTAGRVVTAMADLEAGQYAPVGQTERHAMRMGPAAPVPYASVPLCVSPRARPRPASVRRASVNAGPEAGCQVGVRLVATPDRAEPLRTVARLSGVGRAEERGATSFARQCDTLRGHQAHSWCQAPGATNTPGPLAAWILP
jgi:hypothetical protein